MTNFNELESNARSAIEILEEAYEAEWANFAYDTLTQMTQEGRFEGDELLEAVGEKIRMEAAVQADRNSGGWSGNGASASNALEMVRAGVAQRVFRTRYASLTFKAYRRAEKEAK